MQDAMLEPAPPPLPETVTVIACVTDMMQNQPAILQLPAVLVTGRAVQICAVPLLAIVSEAASVLSDVPKTTTISSPELYVLDVLVMSPPVPVGLAVSQNNVLVRAT